ATGAVDPAFNYASTNTRGGGIWSALAASLDGRAVFATTGNARCWNGGCQAEPSTNRSLSMVRVNAATGALVWQFQPVPFALDDDPDWASGPASVLASCGTLIASTQKDGWTYAINAGSAIPGAAAVRWQFPPTGFPFNPADGTVHGDTRYLRPGAAWGDVFITNGGGLNLTAANGIFDNYSRLHAFNSCAASADRVRWIKDVPGAVGPYSLGPPTVTRGIVYVGTAAGRLIAIADPSIAPPAGSRCIHPDVPTGSCVASGFTLVPDPAVLADIQLDGSILTEPALAKGRVYVATGAGKLYMLEP
ncbi:MAG TPA: PQQ-binding-like beta-propeller repeat protein, partial [Burkholderiales bacterium]|nr:PQQ-binding-like beta-propeller repeat protein [Burkholderiales bacterium]